MEAARKIYVPTAPLRPHRRNSRLDRHDHSDRIVGHGARRRSGVYSPEHKNRASILEVFDKNVKEARQALSTVSDDTLHQDWSLLAGGQTIFTIPKVACIRTWVLNHIIHHRAQLGVYLRLNDIPVPSIYGPSADEG